MAKTGQALLQGLSEFLGDWITRTTTSAGNAGGTTLVDTGLQNVGDNRLAGRQVRLSGTSPFPVVAALSNVQSTGTLTLAQAPTGAQIAGSTAYELHRYDPSLKFKALDKARFEIMDKVFKNVVDDTTTSDGITPYYDIPAAIVQGPHLAYFEKPSGTYTVQWNFVTTPLGDALTGWTASGCTPAVYTRDFTDLLIPKYDLACTKITIAGSTHATYSQTVASMANSVTAVKAAGRTMTFAMWVYSNVSGRVSVKVTDKTNTTTSSFHQGLGWELLWVEATIVGDNATTLTITLDVASAAAPMTIAWNRAWFYYGYKERLVDTIYNQDEPIMTRRRDDADNQFVLSKVPPRGYQIRLLGKAPLSALGDTATSQVTNTMEVDTQTAETLYAKAAELLLEWDALSSDDVPAVKERIAQVQDRARRVEKQWHDVTDRPHLRSPFE